MEIQPLSKVVTNCFLVATVERSKEGISLKYQAKPNLLLARLVRTAAQQILIPANSTNAIFPDSMIEKAIKKCPPSLASKIKVVDKDRGTCNRVRKYLHPILDGIKEDNPDVRGAYAFVFDFLYKMVIACKFQAEADIHQLRFVGNYIDLLKQTLEDEEAKFRLDQLFGIYNSYRKLEKIDTLALLLPSRNICINQKVNDLLDDAEILELSKNRYLLGIPGSAKIAIKRIRKGIREILANKKYSRQIAAATDLIQIVGSSTIGPIPSADIQEVLRSIQLSPYSPPLIDMDYYRFMIVRETHSIGFALTLGDGTFTSEFPPIGSMSARYDYHQFVNAKSKQFPN